MTSLSTCTTCHTKSPSGNRFLKHSVEPLLKHSWVYGEFRWGFSLSLPLLLSHFLSLSFWANDPFSERCSICNALQLLFILWLWQNIRLGGQASHILCIRVFWLWDLVEMEQNYVRNTYRVLCAVCNILYANCTFLCEINLLKNVHYCSVMHFFIEQFVRFAVTWLVIIK